MTAAERDHLYESVGNSLPVGRVGEPHDIAQAYLFLMREKFSTGQIVVVDGDMQHLVAPAAFDPVKEKSHFRVSGPDNVCTVVLPRV
jgi:hypothetical protein